MRSGAKVDWWNVAGILTVSPSGYNPRALGIKIHRLRSSYGANRLTGTGSAVRMQDFGQRGTYELRSRVPT